MADNTPTSPLRSPADELGMRLVAVHLDWKAKEVQRLMDELEASGLEGASAWVALGYAYLNKMHIGPESKEPVARALEALTGVSSLGEACAARELLRQRVMDNETEGVLDEIERIRTVFREVDDPTFLGLIAMTEANFWQSRRDLRRSITVFEEAQRLFDLAGTLKTQIEVRLELADMYWELGELDESERYASWAKELAVEWGEPEMFVRVMNRELNDMVFRGAYADVIAGARQTLVIAMETNNLMGICQMYNIMAMVYASVGDVDLAHQHFQQSLEAAEQLGDHIMIAQLHGQIGTMWFLNGEQTSAMHHLQISVEQAERQGDLKWLQHTLLVLARAQLAAGLLNEAEHSISRAQQDTLVEGGLREIDYLNTLTDLAFRKGDLQTARAHAKRALEILGAHTYADRLLTVYGLLRTIALEANDLAEYVKYNDLYTSLKEEQAGKQTAARLAVMDREHEIERLELERERERSVLYSTLPQHVADRVISGEQVTDQFDMASVLFMDIVGFTTISDRIPAGHVVHLLKAIFDVCDAVCLRHGVTRIKTIGDSYLAVAGVPEPLVDHAQRAAQAALEIMNELNVLELTMPPELGDTSWTKDVGEITIRIGLHCGPLVAGVVGDHHLQYDVWGDTVNVASRMESTGEPGRIQCSEAFAQQLRLQLAVAESAETANSYSQPQLRERGSVEVKGKGSMTTCWLEGA